VAPSPRSFQRDQQIAKVADEIRNLVNAGQSPAALARKVADADFKEEDEWSPRLCPSTWPCSAATVSREPQMLVPYYRLRDLIGTALPRLPLYQVCLGPSVHKQVNSESVKALVEDTGYTGISVTVSNTSYRA
jgi:hypothetical protein